MLNPDDINVRAATFGRMVEDFKSGPVGAFLMERAYQQVAEAKQLLVNADASDADTIRKIQLEARVGEAFITWIEEAIALGRSALEQLIEEENSGS